MKKLFVTTIVSVMMSSLMYAAQEKVSIEGSTTVLPIAQAAAEAFMDKHPSTDIMVKGGGSGVGIASLINKRCTIADSSRSIKEAEIKKALAKGVDPKAHVVAMDGIAVIVHPANTLAAITKEQLKKIYTGKIRTWNQIDPSLGVKKIVVVSRDTASGTYEAFNELALDKAKVTPSSLLEASNKAVVSAVASAPGAIGYIGIAYVDSSIKTVPVDGVICSNATVLRGEYPLSRPLFMYTNGTPKGITKAFIDFVLSAEGQKIVEQTGYVALK